MMFFKLYLTFVISLVAFYVNAFKVPKISMCPRLKPRKTAPKDVTDLRIDDIKYVAALGDSVMAGYLIKGVNYEPGGTGVFNVSFLSEYRGQSYGGGMAKNAITLPNFIRHYNDNVQGGAELDRLFSYCLGPSCNSKKPLYNPLIDNLNAAQTGALASNLDYELDYLIPRMKEYRRYVVKYDTDWKFVTLQIGNNDQCHNCGENAGINTAEAYGNYVEAAIQRIEKEMPYTVVNLLGAYKVSSVFYQTANQPYCVPNVFISNIKVCPCAKEGKFDLMDVASDLYNQKLLAIAKKYSGGPGKTFAVMYSPSPINASSFPIDGFSNIDCFHPSLKSHQWITKSLWNQLFTPLSSKPTTMNFDHNLPIRCPKYSDRLPTIFA